MNVELIMFLHGLLPHVRPCNRCGEPMLRKPKQYVCNACRRRRRREQREQMDEAA